MNKKFCAFSLAEILVTIVVLGIIAAITVPNLINGQVENANRTKVKKAMSAYEKAINMMIIENDIKSTEALRELGQDNCQYTREYFKTVKDGSNNCIFKTADRVWWDITDITNPLISLKDEITDSNKAAIRTNALSLEADKTSFVLIGRFDEVGTLRVDDNAYEQSQMNNMDNKKYMVKLWGFITNTEVKLLSELASCSMNNVTICRVSINGVEITYNKVRTNTDTTVDTLRNGNPISCIYNRENSPQRTCNGYSATAPAGEYWISQDLGKISATEAKSEEVGKLTVYSDFSKYGDYYEAAKLKCEKLGGRLPNLAELKIANENGKLINNVALVRYQAYEEGSSNHSYYMSNGTGIFGVVEGYGKGNSYNRVICIGLE